MRRSRRVAACAAMGMVLAISSLVLQSQVTLSAEARLKAAEMKEMMDGDFTAAINEYQAIAASGHSPLAAQALFKLAECYRRLGRSEATTTYERLLRDYPDEAALVGRAKTGLAALRAPVQVPEITPRRVEGVTEQILAVSRDGGYLATNEGGDLVVRDIIAKRVVRTISAPPSVPGQSSGAAASAAFSADGRRLVYNWDEGTPTNAPVQSSVRIVDLAGGAPVTVPLPAGIGKVSQFAWLLDGRSIVVRIIKPPESSIALVNVADGSLRTLKTLESWQGAEGIRLSPDGRYLAFWMSPRPLTPWDRATHIYTLSLDGVLTDVVGQAGRNRFPVWTPDGARLLFVGDRTGQPALWSLAVQGGAAVGAPAVVKAGFDGRGLELTTSGLLFYNTSSGGDSKVVIAERDPGATPTAQPRVLDSFSGLSATWSPDGQSVAFLKKIESPVQVIVRSVSTGEERVYNSPGGTSVSPHWFPNGSALLLPLYTRPSALDGNTFFRLDLRTGQFTKLFDANPPGRWRSVYVALSPDGRTMYMTGGRDGQGRGRMFQSEVLAVDVATGTDRTVLVWPPGQELLNGGGIAVSPDGQTLVVPDTRPGPPGARLLTSLLRVGVDGQGLRPIVGPVEVPRTCTDECVFSPDGRFVLFIGTQPDDAWRIMRVPVEGGTAVPDGLDFAAARRGVPSLSVGGLASSIAVSPDGKKIMFGHRTTAVIETWMIDNILSLLPAR